MNRVEVRSKYLISRVIFDVKNIFFCRPLEKYWHSGGSGSNRNRNRIIEFLGESTILSNRFNLRMVEIHSRFREYAGVTATFEEF